MPASPFLLSRLAMVCAASAILAGCGTFDGATQRLAGVVTPYRAQVVQGNFVSREQAALLRPGMSRQQVRELLGTPLVASVFHANRWDYVFTLRRQGIAPQAYRLTVFFSGDSLARFEGDTMPTEAEFVASLDVQRRAQGAVPVLEASEAQLQRFAPPAAVPAPPLPAPPVTAYPPLEAPAR